jgi:hypothetical protein
VIADVSNGVIRGPLDTRQKTFQLQAFDAGGLLHDVRSGRTKVE